jgi:hypothetical protein
LKQVEFYEESAPANALEVGAGVFIEST